jgi:hypothetical protein
MKYTTTENFQKLITKLNIVRMNISKLALEEEVIKGKIRNLKQQELNK